MNPSAGRAIAHRLLALTYSTPRRELPAAVNRVLATLPDGAEWFDDVD